MSSPDDIQEKWLHRVQLILDAGKSFLVCAGSECGQANHIGLLIVQFPLFWSVASFFFCCIGIWRAGEPVSVHRAGSES
ncbi:hypothetical protein V1T76_05865 [Roseibium sp. FZY0029]|uniref:hypothetical protein n=1 Tax=Roseibium sp. FZY0029 TaxID=3116647 RepID=UPI002ECDFBC1|nr:hypothetical protein [Roseibium sp. FZY0029]